MNAQINMNDVRAIESDASFLPMVSHDIESLTNAILVASQSLSELSSNPASQNNHAVRDLVQLIRCASLSMAPFINELANIGKRHSNIGRINMRAVYSFQQELEFIKDTFVYEALAKNIDISISVPEEIPVIFCDIDSLRLHVFNNLLSNAIHHTPNGGKIAIRTEIFENQKLIIKVSDSGIGIPASERTSVFRKHLKFDPLRNTSRPTGGTGLHNAQQIICAHNGAIYIIDDPEFSGTTFKIEIPLHAGCMQKSSIGQPFSEQLPETVKN